MKNGSMPSGILGPGKWFFRRMHLAGKMAALLCAMFVPMLGIAFLIEGGGAADQVRDGLHITILVATLMTTALLVYVLMSFYSSFSDDLKQVTQVLEQAAAGNLRETASARGKDELADLALTVAKVTRSISGMVANVRSNAALVAHAGQSLVSGNRDLSDRTEATAANLGQGGQRRGTLRHGAGQRQGDAADQPAGHPRA